MKLLCEKDRCYFCGLRNPPKKEGKKFRSLIEVHHIKEKNDGGNNEPINLVPCCSNCHSKIHLDLIKLDTWYNLAYCHKLKWIDEKGVNRFGPADSPSPRMP